MRGLNMGIIRTVPVRLPSMAEQRAWERRADGVASLRQVAVQELALLDELFASLQQRAFRGDVFSSLPPELERALA